MSHQSPLRSFLNIPTFQFINVIMIDSPHDWLDISPNFNQKTISTYDDPNLKYSEISAANL